MAKYRVYVTTDNRDHVVSMLDLFPASYVDIRPMQPDPFAKAVAQTQAAAPSKPVAQPQAKRQEVHVSEGSISHFIIDYLERQTAPVSVFRIKRAAVEKGIDINSVSSPLSKLVARDAVRRDGFTRSDFMYSLWKPAKVDVFLVGGEDEQEGDETEDASEDEDEDSRPSPTTPPVR